MDNIWPRRVDDPEQASIQDAIMEYVDRRLADVARLFGSPTEVKISDYGASMNEYVRADTDAGDVVVFLPRIGAGDVGGSITVKRATADTDNALKVRPFPGDTIDGVAGDRAVSGIYGALRFMVSDIGKWEIVKSTTQSTTNSPRTKLTWASATTVSVAAAPGQQSSFTVPMQDGKERLFSGTYTFDITKGAADLGLDEGSEANSTWYYLYLVPSAGDDGVLTVRASDNDPDTGPTGYDAWRYEGAVYNDSGGDIRKFYQVANNVFKYAQRYDMETGTTHNASAQSLDVSGHVPDTCGLIHMLLGIQIGASGNADVYVWIDGEESGSDAAKSVFRAISGTAFDYDSATGQVATPTSPKTVHYQRNVISGSLNSCVIAMTGWTDEYLPNAG